MGCLTPKNSVRLSRTQRVAQMIESLDEAIAVEIDAYEAQRDQEESDEESRANLVELITIVCKHIREAQNEIVQTRDLYSHMLQTNNAVDDPQLQKEYDECYGTNKSFWAGVVRLNNFKEQDLIQALRILDGAVVRLREYPLDSALWR